MKLAQQGFELFSIRLIWWIRVCRHLCHCRLPSFVTIAIAFDDSGENIVVQFVKGERSDCQG